LAGNRNRVPTRLEAGGALASGGVAEIVRFPNNVPLWPEVAWLANLHRNGESMCPVERMYVPFRCKHATHRHIRFLFTDGVARRGNPEWSAVSSDGTSKTRLPVAARPDHEVVGPPFESVSLRVAPTRTLVHGNSAGCVFRFRVSPATLRFGSPGEAVSFSKTGVVTRCITGQNDLFFACILHARPC